MQRDIGYAIAKAGEDKEKNGNFSLFFDATNCLSKS